jgi:hypothetical protein
MFPAIMELIGVKLQLKGIGRGVRLQKAEQRDERLPFQDRIHASCSISLFQDRYGAEMSE